MRILATLLFVLTAFSSMASAEFYGTIVSYDQLVHMTPEKRAAYLVEYRKLLIMMENQQRKNGIFEAQRDDSFSEQVAQMVNYFSLIPSAEAGRGAMPAKVAAAPAAPVHVVPMDDGSNWDCSRYNTSDATYTFDPQVGTCIQMYKNWLGRTYPNYSKKEDCPEPSATNEGTTAIPSPAGGGTFACIPISSYNKLSPERREALKSGTFLDPAKISREDVIAPAPKKVAEEPSNTFSERFPEAKGDPSKGSEIVDTTNLPAKDQSRMPMGPQNGKADEPPPKVPAIGENTCTEPSDKTCGDKANDMESVKAFRTDLTEDSNSCIVGGFFAKYSNPNPRKNEGKCDIPNQFPPKPQQGLITCNAGYAICNPFLFCATGKSAGKPLMFHCEPVSGKSGNNVTERCEQWRNIVTGPATAAAAPPAAEKAPAKKGKTKAKAASSPPPAAPNSGDACDPTTPAVKEALGKSSAELAKAWDEQKSDFEKNFKKRCMEKPGEKTTGQGYQDLFCKECNVMKRIIYKMNKAAIDYGCASKAAPKAELSPGGVAPPAGDAETGKANR